jgi:pimeloyl-ACP methyl ester carboxylesterase
MVATKTIDVTHLGGISAGYKLSEPFNASNPTIVLINSFTTSAELYVPWFADSKLTSRINLLAIELLGHGATRAHKAEHWTFWDTSIMNLQVMDALKIEKAFILGTSQGGFVCPRMALLSPERVQGLILLGTCMDREGPEAVARGCWDGYAVGLGLVNAWSVPNKDFEPPPEYIAQISQLGFGNHSAEMMELWTGILRSNYSGDEGRKRMRMSGINLRDRDGLHNRISDIQCPVLWMQGTADQAYSVENAKFEIELFTGAKSKELKIVEGGAHFLSATNPDEVEAAMMAFVDGNA